MEPTWASRVVCRYAPTAPSPPPCPPMQDSTALHDLPAHALLAAYRQHTLSPVEVTQAVPEHIDRWDPHLHATWLLRPDAALAPARDSMSLAPQTIAWQDFERGPEHVRGLRIGLLLDAGCGLPVEPEVRATVEHAATLLERAGAHIVPMRPFLTREMLDGMDHFWRMRSHLDMATLPPER